MGLTIFKTILQANLPEDKADGAVLKQIIDNNTADGVIDGQALYEEIAKRNGWSNPSEDNKETALSYFDEAGEIILSDGEKAGIVIFMTDQAPHINVFAI